VNADALTDGQVLTLSGTDAANVTLVNGDLSAAAYAGNLTVTATTGTNVIITGSGDDTITGGAGADRMTGGNGADAFVYGNLVDITTQTGISIGTADLITDFNGADGDRIVINVAGTADNYIEQAYYGGFAFALNAANSWFATSDNTCYFLTGSTSNPGAGGLLFIDTNFFGGADAVILLPGVTMENFQFSYIGNAFVPG
jgi:Ca2+-binding RTX toxin-like protein